jgi:uracil-DNA glycosylase
MDLIDVQEEASVCSLCTISKDRKIPVFAKGNPDAKIMLCGMCPGSEENSVFNRVGHPFVGKSGKFLDKILDKSKLTLKDVYITNVVKCYVGTSGVKLTNEWINNCFPYLIEQIGAIEPKVILTLGTDAGRTILNLPKSTSLESIRGKRYKFTDKISIIATYHPSYILRFGGNKNANYNNFLDDISWAKEIISR